MSCFLSLAKSEQAAVFDGCFVAVVLKEHNVLLLSLLTLLSPRVQFDPLARTLNAFCPVRDIY